MHAVRASQRARFTVALVGVMAAAVAVTVATTGPTNASGAASAAAASPSTVTPSSTATGSAAAPVPLAGKTVVIDPGHQLGNRHFPRRIARLVNAGGFRKPCNTTGASTHGGFTEPTLNWLVARDLRKRLTSQGAKVVFTRSRNSDHLWGPCVDARARVGNRVHADLTISIHGDGSPYYPAGARGFHVIAPTDRRGWTHDIYRPSRSLALHVRAAMKKAGVPVANYVAGGDGLAFRSDLGTLNLSDVPAVMVELGNMGNSSDAHRMTRSRGRAIYARALAKGVSSYLR